MRKCEIGMVLLQEEKEQRQLRREPQEMDPFAKAVVTTWNVPYDAAVDHVMEVVQQQLVLNTCVVKGIPFKDKDSEKQPSDTGEKAADGAAQYDVRLFYRPGKELSEGNNELILHWRNSSADKKIDSRNTATTVVQRSTPTHITSPPTVCLVKHLAKGKAATLVPPLTNESDPPSHMMVSHGGCIYLQRLFVSPMVNEDADMKCLKMPLIGSGIRLEAFKEFMWQNVLEPKPQNEAGSVRGIGSGTTHGGMRLVNVKPSDGSTAYVTTASMDVATRHMPLANASTTIVAEDRREECWQAAKAFHEAIMVEEPTVQQANHALDLLYKLHATGVSNEWGGTRTSGTHKVEAFKHFSTLWKEMSWALHNVAEVASVMLPVAFAARDLTAQNTLGPKVFLPTEAPPYNHPRPNQSHLTKNGASLKRGRDTEGSLWASYWGQHNDKVQRSSAVAFDGLGHGPDELYNGDFIGMRGSRT